MKVRLTAPSLDFWVDVRVRACGQRWMAVADIGCEQELGLGENARSALEASLSAFGREAVDAFMADPHVRALSGLGCAEQA